MSSRTCLCLGLSVWFLITACGGSADVAVIDGSEQPDADSGEQPAVATDAAPATEATSQPAPTDASSVAVLAPDGPDSLVEAVPVAEHPVTLPSGTSHTSDMRYGGAGLWMAMQGDESTDSGLIELDPATGAVLQTIPIAGPLRVGVGTTAVWADADDAIIRVDAATGETSTIAGAAPSVWGDQVWIETADGAVRIDPSTSEVMTDAGISVEQLVRAVPQSERAAGFPPDGRLPVPFVIAGPDAAWSMIGFEDSALVVEVDPDTGTSRKITEVGAGREDFVLPERMAPVPGGVWLIGEYEDGDGEDRQIAIFVPTVSAGGDVIEVALGDVERYSPIVADEHFVYILPTEGPLVVVDVGTHQEVARIEHEEFVDNAYALALANGAVWVAVQRDLVLEFRSPGG